MEIALPSDTLGWVQFIVQAGALGILTLLIWILPKVLRDTLRELNDSNSKVMGLFHDNAKLERDGFQQRTQLLIGELSQLRMAFPMFSGKIDELIKEIKEQTMVLRDLPDFPSDPDKICKAVERLERLEATVHNLTEMLRSKK